MISRYGGIAALTVLVLCCSCGYHLGGGDLVRKYHSINVPYVEGDLEGILTDSLIKELTTRGGFQYCRSGGMLTLCVELIDFREENIGFRYDREADDTLTKNVIPAETRLKGLAEVTIIDNCSGCCILGPDLVSAFIEYDHDYYSNHGGANVFSLGQLNDIELAQKVAYRPMFRKLARAITTHVIHGWE